MTNRLPFCLQQQCFELFQGSTQFIFRGFKPNKYDEYWQIFLNDRKQTYLGNVKDTPEMQWKFETNWKSERRISIEAERDLKKIMKLVNNGYQTLNPVNYRFKCGMCHRSIRDQHSRDQGYDKGCFQKLLDLRESERKQGAVSHRLVKRRISMNLRSNKILGIGTEETCMTQNE